VPGPNGIRSLERSGPFDSADPRRRNAGTASTPGENERSVPAFCSRSPGGRVRPTILIWTIFSLHAGDLPGILHCVACIST